MSTKPITADPRLPTPDPIAGGAGEAVRLPEAAERVHQELLVWLRSDPERTALVPFVASLPVLNPVRYDAFLNSLRSEIFAQAEPGEKASVTYQRASAQEKLLSQLRMLQAINADPQTLLSKLDERRADVLTVVGCMESLDYEALGRMFRKAARLCDDINTLLEMMAVFSTNAQWIRKLRGIRHDLNNIFTVAEGEIELALQAMSTSDYTGFAQTSQRFRARANRFIDALSIPVFPFHRQLRLAPITVDHTLLNQYHVELHDHSSLADQLHIEGEIPPLFVDRYLLEDVLMNLVNNAMKHGRPFIDAGGKKYYKLGYDPNHNALTIADAGGEISAVDLQRIGEEGFRAAPEKADGSGLGSGNVIDALTRMGGAFWLTSTPGVGTYAYCALPRAPQSRAHDRALLNRHRSVLARIDSIPDLLPERRHALVKASVRLHDQTVTDLDQASLSGLDSGALESVLAQSTADCDAVLSDLGVPDVTEQTALGQFESPYPSAAELGMFSATVYAAPALPTILH